VSLANVLYPRYNLHVESVNHICFLNMVVLYMLGINVLYGLIINVLYGLIHRLFNTIIFIKNNLSYLI